MNEGKRLSKRQLERLISRLSERDLNILKAIRKYRFMMTHQVQALFFNDSSNQTASRRAGNRALKRLKELGLITTLERRIGGVRAGSASYVWCLTGAGERLLLTSERSGSTDNPARKRLYEPSIRFLEHTLAITETFVQLTLIAEKCDVKIESVDLEPDCWRPYVGESGVLSYLKPDMYLKTLSYSYEDHWFMEIDLGTESPSRIIGKCHQYYRYYLSGAEQKGSGVFPLVVWITKDSKRFTGLKAHITENFNGKPNIFVVITPDQLERLVSLGLDALNNLTGMEVTDTAAGSAENCRNDLKSNRDRVILLIDDQKEDTKHG